MTVLPAATGPQCSVLEDLLCFDLYAASRAMTALYRPLLEAHGVTYPQYLVLVVLWRQGPSGIRDIGTTLRLDHGTLTPLLSRMEQRGLVTRDRESIDRRAVTVTLAPAGEDLRSLFDEVQCVVRQALGLSTEEMLDLQSTLRSLTRTISRT